MTKIYEIISSVTLGGAENVVFNLVENCSLRFPKKFNFTIIELYATKSYYALRKKVKLRSMGIRVITLVPTSKRVSLIIAPFRLVYHIAKESPSIIHSHTDLPDFVLSISLKMFNIKNTKIVRSIHNTDLWSKHKTLGRFVESSFKDDSIIGVSKAALNSYISLRRRCKLKVSSNTSVIYNGCEIPIKEFYHFKLSNDKINIAFCGRFVYQKGLDILLDEISKLEDEVKNKIVFHFIGDGPYKYMIVELMKKNKNIILHRPVINLSSKFHGFDYIIMPSRFEGLPLISIESSLCKVPVIAAKVSGLDETLPLDWPLLFSLDRSEDFKDLLQKIAHSSFDLFKLKTLAYNFAANKFSIEKMIRSYVEVYTL